MNKHTHRIQHPLRRQGTTARPRPQRLAVALALAAVLAPGLAGARDLYWVGGSNAGTNIGGWSAPGNWLVSTGGQAQPAAGDSLHFAGSKTSNVNDLGYRIYNSISFEAGASAFTVHGAPNNIGLTGGIRNLSSNVQTLDWGGNNGIVIAADQIWDGGAAGLVVMAGKDQHAALTLQNKVSFSTLQTDAIGNSPDDLNAKLTVRASSRYSGASTVTIGANAGASGAVYVQGAGSSFAAGTDLVVGDLGTGFMQVESGATATSNALYFGRSGGAGTLNVTGAGSTLSTQTALLTEGAVSVMQGGQIKVSDRVTIADYPGVASTVTVQGTGSLLQVGGRLTVGAGGSGQLNVMTGGTVDTQTLSIGTGGVVNLNGGTLAVLYDDTQGSLNWLSGTLSFKGTGRTGAGTLLGVNQVVGANATLQASELIVVNGTALSFASGSNGSVFNLTVDAGATLNVGTQSNVAIGGVFNNGSLVLDGGTLSGQVTNNAYMSANGTIGPSGQIVNNGVLSQSGALTISATGRNVNNGSWEIASGRGLQIVGTTLLNAGTMNIGGDTIGGSGALVNDTSGTIAGYGAITARLSNAGRVVVDGGQMVIGQASSNTGSMLLNSALATLSGGAITNAGRIDGLGQVNNDVVNQGTVQARGGLLVLTGAVNNTGVLAVGRDATLLITRGLASNDGKIQLAARGRAGQQRPVHGQCGGRRDQRVRRRAQRFADQQRQGAAQRGHVGGVCRRAGQ